MQRTKSKLLSILLSLVMLLSLLPTTAFAAGNPDPTAVFVDEGKSFYNGRLYYKSGDDDKNFTGTKDNYIAHYNPDTGTLTLNGYSGGSISVGGVSRSDITVVLIGTNTINGSLTNEVGGDITVTSESGGTLSITNTLSGSNAAIGIETGLASSYTTGNVTIKGNAKVTINMTHNGTSTYEKAYGIFAKQNITISENASVDITCATPNNTTGGGNCNGLYAAKDVTIDTNGTIKIDVTNAGKDKDNGYSYGVYHMSTATLTKVGNMEVQWKKEANNTRYSGGAFTKGATFSDTDHAINEDTTNCYASYRFGTPRKVTAGNGQLTGPGVKYANNSGYFLAGDKVNIKPNEKKSSDGTLIPFKEWTFSDVMLDKSATTASNSFTVPGKDVTVTATYNPFDGAPVFTRTSDSSGTIAFKTAVNPDNSEFFEYVKDGETAYNRPYSQPTTTSSASPYEYSLSVSTYYAGDIKNLEAGDYRMAVTLNGERYLSEKFTVNYTAPVTTYTVSFNANGGTGTMADVTGVSGEYTLPANGFTAPADKQFKGWATSADGSVISGTTHEVSSDTTFYAIWESKEYSITVTDGKATIGAGSEISKAAEGTAVTLTANAAPTGKVFDKWEVVSGGITLADANSATTTFTMPASAVSVKATYKTKPVTTYNLTTSVNGGHGTISAGENGITEGTSKIITFTPDSGYEIDKVMVNGTETTVTGNTLTVTMDGNKNVVVTYKAIEYTITVTDGKATVGAGSEISKAAEGTAVTLTANAASSDKVFDKWVVESGSVALADANSTTTTFTMPASAVSVKATYKNAPHTHTYNQETVKPEALKTPADCTSNAVYFKSCSCGAISTTDTFVAMDTALGHAHGSDWKYDSTSHWHECSRCHDKKDEAAHDYGSDNVCDTCGYNKTVPHTHNLTLVAAKAATCTEGGKKAYYKCEGCGKFYEDVLGTKEITDLASWGNIAKIAHTTKQTVTKATPTANGKIVNYCSVCKKTLSTTVIPNASSIKLKATSLTYNGKVRTPKVIVKDRTGKTLVKNTDYTVSYAKGRKYVGKYAVKITFKGKYSGTKTLYFTIKPKATSISSLTAGSKKFTVKWKKQATQTTGYQVQYSASSKFSKAKTVTVGKNTTVSKKISKLSGKKKYYVRVRTYKTVKINGKSIRIYSGWSKAKTVTTKK